MRILAIDPGNAESALLLYDPDGERVVWWVKMPNDQVRKQHTAFGIADVLAVEMIASYGMPVGREVFETCVWIGRFIERWGDRSGYPHFLIPRIEVKSHLCHSGKAKDSNVRQALIDRFGPGKERAIGRKASPGPLYGLSGDGWAALGVAVTAAETRLSEEVAA